MKIVLYEKKSDCCGCEACVNICRNGAISMKEDEEGFSYPVIDENVCIQCGMCQKVCPIKAKEEEKKSGEKYIGIINLQYTQNYGAVIAAAALEDTVRKIHGGGYTVQTLCVCPSYPFQYRIQHILDNKKAWGGWKFYFKNIADRRNKTEKDALREKHFDTFRNNFLNMSNVFNTAEQLKNADINYRAFITGSDVVWAPRRVDNFRSDIYFLKFTDKTQKAVAYAPSLDCGDNKVLKKLSPYYRDGLKYLDGVSVREKSNIEFIQSLTDKKVYECCDPAFLVDEEYYDKMIKTAQIEDDGQKFIYVYILEVNDEIVRYANKLAKEKNLKICFYSKFHKDYAAKSEDCTADGPAEFLYRLKNAEYVLTNSFHCVVFSLMFRKKFLSFTRSKISIKSSDLLEKFNLMNRIITKKNKINIDEDIDFENVEKVISKMRKESLDYLKNSLADI